MPMEGTIAIASNFGDRKGEVIFIPVPGYYTVYTYIYNNYGFFFINFHLAVSKIVRCNVCLA